MKTFFLIVNLMLSITAIALAQTGSISGKVIDANSGEELIGATVIISGTITGTIADFDGNYTLSDLEPGSYNITVSFVSYQTQEFTDVVVNAGEVTIVDISMGEAVTQLDEVKVVARSRQRTEAALQVLQRRSAVVLDGISSQQISRLGDSDAAGALKRVTGVSVLGDKYVFVRGLSERYMKITLNGAEIPGLDPDVNTVQMDLFPSNIIENMIVHKTFSPNLPTLTGGHVDIITKDFPLEPTLNFSATFGYNKQTSFIDNFPTYESGKKDNLGTDDGTRDVPDEVRDVEWQIYYTPADSIFYYSTRFNKNWDTRTKPTFLNQSYSLSYGNSFNIFNDDKIGLIAAISYKKEYSYFDNGEIVQLSRNASVWADLDETYGKEEVIWSGMLGLTYKFGTYNKIGINFMHNHSGAAGTRYKVGTREVYPGGSPAQEPSLEYVERSITAAQINGKHVLPSLSKVQINWFGSYSYSMQNEPDMRFWYNLFQVNDATGDTSYSMISNARPVRYYRYLNEADIHGSLEILIPMDQIIPKSNLKFGADYISKDRNADEYRFTLNTNQGSPFFNGDRRAYVDDSRIVDAETLFTPGRIFYGSNLLTNDVYSYTSEEISATGFVMMDVPVYEFMRIVGGVKFEHTDVFVENKVVADSINWQNRYDPRWNVSYQTIKDKYKKGEYNTNDWLPSLNLTFFLSEKMNLRLNYWKSISKPALREIAPLSYYDFLLGIRFTGNENLHRSTNFNYDIRWEYFFNPGELVSISGFYKVLKDPIEIYAPETANNIEYFFRNGKNTDIIGIETEFRKALDFFDFTRHFQIGFNMTLVYSQIEEDEARMEEALQINPDFPGTRPMFGQAPYVFNSYLIYDNPDIGLEANLAYNISGPKLIILSQSAAPNIYEMPSHRLDFNISKHITKMISVKFAVKNILNSKSQTAYLNHEVEDLKLNNLLSFTKFDDPIANFRSYKQGTLFELGITLDL